MARPVGTKNIMRSPKEKESMILESYEYGSTKVAAKYGVDLRLFRRWKAKYRDQGIKGFENQTGKTKCASKGNRLAGLMRKKNKTEEEKLLLENLLLKVENARLKKGYLVKGVGIKKEYVTIKDLNTKS